MNAIDDLVRDVLESTAAVIPMSPPWTATDAKVRAKGIRRRTQIRTGVGVLLASSIVAIGASAFQVPLLAHREQPANERLASAPATLGYWSRWLPTRHFGPKPPQPVLDMVASGRPVDILASGSFPDGNFFVIQMTHGHPGDVEFDQGTSVKDLVGQQQAHLYGDAPFLLLFSDRHAADGSGWLVLLTRPGTTAATLRSPSGQTRQLPIRDGIALLRSDAGQLPDGVFSLYAGDKSPYYVGALH